MKRPRRALAAVACATVGILVVAGALNAHDFWIVPNAFAIADGGTVEVVGFRLGGATSSGRQGNTASDSADVIAVVRRYHSALASGDSAAALSLLAADAVILESGGMQTREEYRSHHLPADINFARAVPSEQSNVRVTIHGDVAWVSSTSTRRGEYRGRQINSTGAELVVLKREASGWQIRAIHWSSRSRTP